MHGVAVRSSALLGLIDDVDCAVVSLAFTKDPASPVQLQHVATIPAFAYVATGALAHQRSCVQLPCCPDNIKQRVLALLKDNNRSLSRTCEALAILSSIVTAGWDTKECFQTPGWVPVCR